MSVFFMLFRIVLSIFIFLIMALSSVWIIIEVVDEIRDAIDNRKRYKGRN